MPRQTKQQPKTIAAKVVFTDVRFDNIAVVWGIGTDELTLTHGDSIMKRSFNKGGISNVQHAEDLAQVWFDSLAGVFAETAVTDEYEDGDE